MSTGTEAPSATLGLRTTVSSTGVAVLLLLDGADPAAVGAFDPAGPTAVVEVDVPDVHDASASASRAPKATVRGAVGIARRATRGDPAVVVVMGGLPLGQAGSSVSVGA
ncbi:MAG: hypothetical protein IPH27_04415 [Actinomycetales bacterium]|nr:hypothetical protein [Candidatus Phosphoribacter baldrii]